jgi:hypothetical protein
VSKTQTGIGGGIAGDFPICVVPMLHQDLKRENCRCGDISARSAIRRRVTDRIRAVPNEKITWATKWRYARNTEQTEFLQTVFATSACRQEVLNAGMILWRAQRGHDMRADPTDGGQVEETPATLYLNCTSISLIGLRSGRMVTAIFGVKLKIID